VGRQREAGLCVFFRQGRVCWEAVGGSDRQEAVVGNSSRARQGSRGRAMMCEWQGHAMRSSEMLRGQRTGTPQLGLWLELELTCRPTTPTAGACSLPAWPQARPPGCSAAHACRPGSEGGRH
jgi:hypothetical protein